MSYLLHYGVGADDGAPGRGSGRYPLGSGDRPYQHDPDFSVSQEALKIRGIPNDEKKRIKELRKNLQSKLKSVHKVDKDLKTRLDKTNKTIEKDWTRSILNKKQNYTDEELNKIKQGEKENAKKNYDKVLQGSYYYKEMLEAADTFVTAYKDETIDSIKYKYQDTLTKKEKESFWAYAQYLYEYENYPEYFNYHLQKHG